MVRDCGVIGLNVVAPGDVVRRVVAVGHVDQARAARDRVDAQRAAPRPSDILHVAEIIERDGFVDVRLRRGQGQGRADNGRQPKVAVALHRLASVGDRRDSADRIVEAVLARVGIRDLRAAGIRDPRQPAIVVIARAGIRCRVLIADRRAHGIRERGRGGRVHLPAVRLVLRHQVAQPVENILHLVEDAAVFPFARGQDHVAQRIVARGQGSDRGVHLVGERDDVIEDLPAQQVVLVIVATAVAVGLRGHLSQRVIARLLRGAVGILDLP